jgi:hypothetical protein
MPSTDRLCRGLPKLCTLRLSPEGLLLDIVLALTLKPVYYLYGTLTFLDFCVKKRAVVGKVQVKVETETNSNLFELVRVTRPSQMQLFTLIDIFFDGLSPIPTGTHLRLSPINLDQIQNEVFSIFNFLPTTNFKLQPQLQQPFF